MACSHNVVFLLDTASSVQKVSLHRGILRILNYLGCRFGLAKVRWGFKFFDSLGAQGRTSQVGNFRELGSCSWENFEELLEARFGGQAHSSRLPGPKPRAALIRNILKEALLDYQWDRPEIASPAKPVLRSQKNKSALPLDKPPANWNSSDGFVNAVFLFSPCPHSQREVLQFVSGSHIHLSDEPPTSQDLTEKFVPKGIQDMMAGKKITLYWVDTAEWSQVLESSDHVGYWMLVELLRPLGGTILPSNILVQDSSCQQKGVTPGFLEDPTFSELPFTQWTTILPFESTLNCLFSSPSALQVSFPQLEGVLILKTDEAEEPQSCAVTLEPLIVGQRHFEGPVNISLKYTVTGWDAVHAGSFHTERWVLRNSRTGQSVQETFWFQQLIKHVLAQGLHMVAEVSPSGSCLPCTGIISPITDTVAVFSLLSYEFTAESDKALLQMAAEGNVSKDEDFSLPEIMNSMLNHVDDSREDDSAISAEIPSPEWAQQELARTHRWNPAVVEGWYLSSNLCGASSHLMESFRLQQAPSVAEDETPNPEMELTHRLSEFYRRKVSESTASSHQQGHKKRHGVPRTPVRQKMKTMPRSLQMLNAARLNVKAQKFQPDGEAPVGEKIPRSSLSRRSDVKVEEKGRTVKTKMGFKTEEEMLSYLTARYQKAVDDEEILFACVQEMVTAISAFLKSSGSKPREMACADIIRSCLLKTSKALRQPLGGSPEKESKVKECQLQVYLRLEMSLQCPLLQNNVDEMEQLVEEMTEMLRILCLTKDPAHLTKFLEEVVELYMESIPKILGDLYYSLGTQIPPKLASLLPADIFSDDSINPGSQTASLPNSIASVSVKHSVLSSVSLSTEAEQLEELRTRSAKKRKNSLARHRSVTEASQNLRQIEIPQVSKCRPKKDSSEACLSVKSLPPAQKAAVQEVTKVRRNLFNEEMLSAGTSALKKIPRSQSVSVLEGLKHKRSQSNDVTRDNHKLLTKRVAETPLHKQISGRLLHKQIKGRCSDPGSEVGIVEESPEKTISCGLRRSPRFKHLFPDRTLSSSFLPSQRSLRNTRAGSPRGEGPGAPEGSTGPALPNVKRAIQSPKSLLFGAVLGVSSLEGMDSPGTRRKALAADDPPVYQTPRKTPLRRSQRLLSPPHNTPRRSPRLQEKLQKIPLPRQTAAKNLGKLFSPCRQKSKSLPECRGKGEEHLVPTTPAKERFSSPSKTSQLQTSGKQARDEAFDDVFMSPPSNSSSAAASFVAAPFLLSSWGELQPPKATSPAVQRGSLEAEPELLSPLEVDSAQPEIAPTKSRGASSELPSSPQSAELLQAHSAFLPAANSPDSSPALSAVGTHTLSPVRARKLSRMSHTPPECPREPLSIADTSPPEDVQSPSCVSEQLPYGCDRLLTEAKLPGKAGTAEQMLSIQRPEQTADAMSPPSKRSLERRLSSELSAKDPARVPAGVGVCKRLRSSSVAGAAGFESLAGSSAVELGPETSQGFADRVLPAEKSAGLQGPLFPSPHRDDLPSSSATPTSACRAYVLRCTPDRRQREAAARLGNPVKAPVCRTPPSTRAWLPASSPPTYAVELEMQASGLPKLRIKKVASGSAPEPHPPAETGKRQGEESDPAAGDLSVIWCNRHPGKSEPASVSPSCFRSAHTTPGKGGGGQTYICQSYTPTRCPPSATSPPQGGAALLWTPSPRQKGKVTPEAIKDWPRRKRATVGCSRSERPTNAPELLGADKALLLEFELEGVCRLQSPCSDAEPSGDDGGGSLKFRKRALEQGLAPEEGVAQDVKRPCLRREEPDVAELLSTGKGGVDPSRTGLEEDGDIFSISGSALTPPRSSSKNSISASSLWALTQSPLLYQGHSAALRKCPTDDDSMWGTAAEDLSPFRSVVSRKRPLSRTYSRKRLLS